jgi:hypothetical protein
VSAIAFALVLFGIAVNVPFVFDHPETHVLNVASAGFGAGVAFSMLVDVLVWRRVR